MQEREKIPGKVPGSLGQKGEAFMGDSPPRCTHMENICILLPHICYFTLCLPDRIRQNICNIRYSLPTTIGCKIDGNLCEKRV